MPNHAAKYPTSNSSDRIISKLFRVMETVALINSTKDMNQLISLILIAVKEVMDVEASSLAQVDPFSNELYFSDTAGGSEKVKQIRLKIGEGIAGWVAKTKSPMIVNDVSANKQHYTVADHKTSFKTRSIVCVPLVVRDQVIGVLQALNKNNRADFTEDDLRIFNAFANQVAVALENARLNVLALFDDLTKIHNRRYFNAWIEQEFGRVKRFRANLSLILIDIDHFKVVNDTYGHLAGDFILVKLVDTLKNMIRRQSDLFVRYGGEEFLIVLQETSLSQACILAERYRQEVEKTIFDYNGNRIPIRISAGVVNYRKNPVDTAELFIHYADEMLYKAKRMGRNQVQVLFSN